MSVDQQNSNCFLCCQGRLLEQIYYPFCDLIAEQFCSCPMGNAAFKKWCQSNKVQMGIKQKRQKEIEKALKFSSISKRWKEKSLENLQGQEKLKQTINLYLDNFPKLTEKGQGFYLWSNGSGRGKTHILSAICQQVIKRYASPSIFITEEQLFYKIREAFDEKNISEQQRLNKFLKIESLFIDDFGATKITEWKNEVLTGILDYRLNNALPTFFTSNYHPEDYKRLVSHTISLARPERIPSRIYGICRNFIVEVKGEDYNKLLPNKT